MIARRYAKILQPPGLMQVQKFPPRGLFNPIAFASAQSKLFVLDMGDSCMAKYDPERNTCLADTVRNGNRSQIHWDMVCIQRKDYGGGEIRFDGKLVRKDGLFVMPKLKGLNPNKLGA